MRNPIYLKDLKTMLNNGVIIQKWSDDIEDFKILHQTPVFECDNVNLTEELLNMQVCSISGYTECGINYVVIEVK